MFRKIFIINVSITSIGVLESHFHCSPQTVVLTAFINYAHELTEETGQIQPLSSFSTIITTQRPIQKDILIYTLLNSYIVQRLSINLFTHILIMSR